jgi:hypothetical protein
MVRQLFRIGSSDNRFQHEPFGDPVTEKISRTGYLIAHLINNKMKNGTEKKPHQHLIPSGAPGKEQKQKHPLPAMKNQDKPFEPVSIKGGKKSFHAEPEAVFPEIVEYMIDIDEKPAKKRDCSNRYRSRNPVQNPGNSRRGGNMYYWSH